MTVHSTITKAQPFSFSPLAISLGQRDTAVVTIRKALDELSADLVGGTLEELNEQASSFADARAAFLQARAAASEFSATHLDGEMNDPGVEAAEAAFGKLVDAQYAVFRKMILTPAECVQDIVDKLTYFNECDGTGEFGALEYTRQIESDLKRVTAIPVGPFMRGPLLAWERAYAAFLESHRAAQEFDRDELGPVVRQIDQIHAKYPDWTPANPQSAEHRADLEQVPNFSELQNRSMDLWGDRTDALMNLWLAPAPSPAELAVKLELFRQDDGHELTRAGEFMGCFASDARRFGRLGAFVQTDADLLAAFAGLRREMVDYLAKGCGTKEEDEAAEYRVDKLEEVMWRTRASTVEGVVAKLRVAFQHMGCGMWSDHATADPAHPDFVRGIQLADMYPQMVWSAVEDLARIGGIDLSKQGAEPIAVH